MIYYSIERTLDYYPHVETSTIFITSNKKTALKKFDELKEECSIKKDTKEFILYEWRTEETKVIINRCDDYSFE